MMRLQSPSLEFACDNNVDPCFPTNLSALSTDPISCSSTNLSLALGDAQDDIVETVDVSSTLEFVWVPLCVFVTGVLKEDSL